MRSHLSLTCLLALLAACEPRGATPAGDPDQVRAAIMEQEEALRRAMVAEDTAALGALWAPEYLSTSAVGHTSTRAEALMAYGGGLVTVDTAELSEVDVRAYGPTAVSLGYLRWAGAAAGRPFGATVRFQHVWVTDGGRWRLVASQLTSQGMSGPPPATRD